MAQTLKKLQYYMTHTHYTCHLKCKLLTQTSKLYSSPIEEEVLGQPFWSNDLEDDLVGLQGLAVDPAGKGRMQALGQPLAYCQLLGHNLVFGIVLQNL